jgi:hypothetical protein
MSAFGPFYPPELQVVVNHAERLSDLLVAHELSPPTDEWAVAWVVGRANEVAELALDVTSSWRAGTLDVTSAAAVLRTYLASLHEGMARHLAHTPARCCLSEDETTNPGAPSEGSRTRCETIGELRQCMHKGSWLP